MSALDTSPGNGGCSPGIPVELAAVRSAISFTAGVEDQRRVSRTTG